MLSTIDIHNYHLISQVSLALSTGLITITGESGAGKSIFIDALMWCLGHDSDVAKPGAKVSLCWELTPDHPATAWLESQSIDTEDCIISRQKLASGRSRFTINQQPIPKSLVVQLAQKLVTIHGQHHHLSYLKPQQQTAIIDVYANQLDLKANLKKIYDEIKQLECDINHATSAIQQQQSAMELKQYYLEELEQAQLIKGEFDELLQQQKQREKQVHLTQILEQLNQSFYQSDHKHINQRIQTIQNKLIALTDIYPNLSSLIENLETLQLQIDDCTQQAQEIERSCGHKHSSQSTQQRLEMLTDLARKHHIDPDELIDLQKELSQTLQDHQDLCAKLPQWQKDLQTQQQQYRTIAENLHKHRVIAAKKLSDQVSQCLEKLGLQTSRFDIDVRHNPERRPSVDGLDDIEFLFGDKQNTLRTLDSGISGGELSRLALAIQSCRKTKAVETLFFDEIDVGTSGQSANLIGQLLRQIAKHQQVICITHQAQVARYAHQHLGVTKATPTSTSIQSMQPHQVVDEIARMIGGNSSSKQAQAHAKTLLDEVLDDEVMN